MADLLALYRTGATYTAAVGGRRDETAESTGFATFVRDIAAADNEGALACWRDVLAGVDEPTVVGRGVAASVDEAPVDHSIALGRELTEAIEQFSRDHGVTVATLVQFAWSVLLSRLTGSQQVVFGETVSGRPAELAGVETMVGLFINTLPVVVDVDPDAACTAVLDQMHKHKLAVLDHQHLGLAELTQLSGHPVLFDTLTVYESYPVDEAALAAASASGGADDPVIRGIETTDATHYPLNLAVSPTSEGLVMTLKYLPAEFNSDQIATFGAGLATILQTVPQTPSIRTGDLPLAPAATLAELTPVAGAPAVAAVPITELLAATVDSHRSRTAVSDASGASLTYHELDRQSARLAARLRQQGVASGDVVALALPRSVELLAAIWAV